MRRMEKPAPWLLKVPFGGSGEAVLETRFRIEGRLENGDTGILVERVEQTFLSAQMIGGISLTDYIPP